jgi:hypothetical protein
MEPTITCDDYRRLYPQNTSYPIPKEVPQTPQYRAWQEHGLDCAECCLWDMEQQVRNRGYRVEDSPCVHIAYYLTETCDQHPDAWDCSWCGFVLTPVRAPWP